MRPFGGVLCPFCSFPAASPPVCAPISSAASSVARARPCALRRARFARSAALSRASRVSVRGSLGGFAMPPVSDLARLRPACAGPGCAKFAFRVGKGEIFPWPPCAPRAVGLKPRPQCCGSSVVEHSLGKGEVESSILSHSTIFLLQRISTRPVGFAEMRQPAIRVAYRGQNAGIAGIFRSRAAPRTLAALQVTDAPAIRSRCGAGSSRPGQCPGR